MAGGYATGAPIVGWEQEGDPMRLARLRGVLAALLALALCIPLVEAAGIGLTIHQIDSSQFPRVRTLVTAADDQGVRIMDLETDPQSFELLEDDKPVTGVKVEPIVDAEEPIAVALVIDVSGSMADEGRMDAAKQAATAFVDVLGSKDAVAVIAFSTEVRIVQGYTSDKGLLKNAINGLAPRGDTDLYGAVTQSAQLIGALPMAQRGILLISDGEDTINKQTLDGSIQAAKAARTAVYPFGLGKDASSGPLKDVLLKLGTGTGGRATFVANPGDLKSIFAKQSEQFRRRYVITYTSKLPGDGKQHTLTLRAKKGGQSAEIKGAFTTKHTPLDFDVVGLSDATKVNGTIRVQLALKGGAPQQIELLVDDKSRGTAGAPFALQWDTSAETPGLHKVIVRVKDSSGATSDRSFVVDVQGPATAVASPTVAATATSAVRALPTATAAPAAAASDNTLLFAIAGIVGLGLGGTVLFLLLRKRPVAPTPPPAAPEPPRPMDRTEVILPPEPEAPPPPPVEATIVAAPPPPLQPRARLQVTHHGSDWEFIADKPEVVVGRESSCDIAIKDPLASRRHARFVVEGGEFWLEDLKSLNGTRANGEVVARHRLAAGDQVRIGDAVIVFSPLPR